MSAAELVIEKFGGQSSLARLLGKGPSTIQYWAKAGTIPAKWQRPLLDLAQARGIDLGPSDFLARPTPEGEILDKPELALPEARWPGMLMIGDQEVQVYVLDDGRRVISRTAATNVLTDNTGGGNLEHYIGVVGLREFLPAGLQDQMIEFRMPGVVNKTVRGIDSETFLEICKAYVRARDAGRLQTEKQTEIAIKAGMFLAACAKVGLVALIDEATGYQYERARDALQFKLKLYLEEEIRQWEKTFPDELWEEFGRLTHWRGNIHKRPKYWGHLVMELVYDYLDKDVADWLRANAPKPVARHNYHQWLSSQFGLQKLIQHIWMLIGMARGCQSMQELKTKMAETHGRQAVQYTFYLPIAPDEPRFAYQPRPRPAPRSQKTAGQQIELT